MLSQIIRIGNNNYYVYFDENEDCYTYSIVLANNDETRVLEEREAKDLLSNLFNKKLDFLEHKDGYDIFIDEGNYKRYFKDNKEDMKMFYLNNGQDAILSLGKDKEIMPKIKQFIYKYKDGISVFMISSYIMFFASPLYNAYDELVKPIYYDSNRHVYSKTITLEDTKDRINNSEGSLTDEMKEYLYNEDFIRDVLNTADPSRNYILFKKTNNINVICDEDECEEKDVYGFYRPLNSNEIVLISDSYYIFNIALAHEFIHLMQDNNQYHYVREACAEMLAGEYYGSIVSSYPVQRDNVRLLMEMIGPKPVFELNFKGDTSSFEKAIYNSLDKEKANKLLKLFTTAPNSDDNIKEKDDQIYQLLDEISYNISGTRLDDPNNHYLDYSLLRNFYFNNNRRGYFMEQNEIINGDILEELSINDINKDDIEFAYIDKRKEVSEEEYNIKKEDGDGSSYTYEDEHVKEPIDFDRDIQTGEQIYIFEDGKELKYNEALEKGYFVRKYYYKCPEFIPDVDIDNIEENYDNTIRRLTIVYKDGKRAIFNEDENGFGLGTLYSKDRRVIVPSIATLFPEQVPVAKTAKVISEDAKSTGTYLATVVAHQYNSKKH